VISWVWWIGLLFYVGPIVLFIVCCLTVAWMASAVFRNVMQAFRK
jgi:hypothetical protein